MLHPIDKCRGHECGADRAERAGGTPRTGGQSLSGRKITSRVEAGRGHINRATFPQRHERDGITCRLSVREGMVTFRIEDAACPDRWERFEVPLEELAAWLEGVAKEEGS